MKKGLLHLTLTIGVLALGFLIFRGGCRSSTVPDTCPECSTPATPLDPAATGTIEGRVRYSGPTTADRFLSGPSGSPECAYHPPIPDETIVAEGGFLGNAVVRVRSGFGKHRFAVPAEPAVLTNRQCRYEPHVLAARAHQVVEIRNDDQALHNIHSLSKKHPFNFALPQSGMKSVRRFHEEDLLSLKCDVHPWMQGYLVVVDHPFFAVTGKDGAFSLKGVPAGDVEIEVWHEKLRTRTKKVTVEAGKTAALDVSFD